MGSLHFRRIELVTSLNELVGYKAGVALNREQMNALFATLQHRAFKGEL
jgi:hypothetical protein